jgi:hypothetical protein
MAVYDRRSFLGLGVGTMIVRSLPPLARSRSLVAEPSSAFPRQDPAMVTDLVRFAHFDVAKVKQLVERHPALAKAAVDWGFGDWEDALGAASHTGRRDIADVLIANGARPTLFSATMMGQLEVVKAFLSAAPGSQGTRGPHSITLLAHARAGGERARAVAGYLEQIDGADPAPAAAIVMTDAERLKYPGTYSFGGAPDEVLSVVNEKSGLTITRPGLPYVRSLTPVGSDEFVPIGAEAVRIRFTFDPSGVAELGIFDPEPVVTARRTKV